MKIQNITIQGFKSFNLPQTIDLSEKGFHYVSGMNLAEPRLGGNGAGKSTVFEALCWVLYGKTSMNVKAGNIKNWNENSERCCVTLEFEKHGKDYSVYRSYRPNSLMLTIGEQNDYKTITQEEVEGIVGLNFQSFLFSVFVSQFSNKFFDLDPAPKLEVFSQTLMLDKWLTYSEGANKKRKDGEDIIVKQRSEVQKLKGQFEELNNNNYDALNKKWDGERSKRLASEQGIHDREVESKTRYEKKLLDINIEIDTIQKSIFEVRNQIDEIEKPLKNIKKQMSESSSKVGYAKAELITTKKQIENLNRVGAICSECKQRVSAIHMKKEKDKLNKSLTETNKNLTATQKRYNDLIDKETVIQRKTKRLNTSIRNKESELNTMSPTQKKYTASVLSNQALLKATVRMIEKIKAETNPYQKLIQDTKEKKRILTKSIRAINKTISDGEASIDMYLYWQKAFKQIRLFVINEALDELQIQMNNSLQELGLDGWEIHLAVDRETKSKTISRGFTILIFSPINNELVPFECWSGGEAQRLKIAGTLAMSDFIRSRMGEDWNLEVFDEPTAWLGEEGIEDMLEVLRARSNNNNRPTYIIDHRNFDTYGDFNSHIKIIKNKGGSEISKG